MVACPEQTMARPAITWVGKDRQEGNGRAEHARAWKVRGRGER